MIGPEPWLDAAAEALRVYLPAELSAIDPELKAPLDEGGAIGQPMTDYYAGVVRKVLRYPIIEVAVPDDSLTNFSLARLTGDYELNMIVMATIRDADLGVGRLYRMQIAYRRAMLGVLLDPEKFLAGGAITAVRTAYRQSPEDREDAEMFVGAIAVGLTIETTDSREL